MNDATREAGRDPQTEDGGAAPPLEPTAAPTETPRGGASDGPRVRWGAVAGGAAVLVLSLAGWWWTIDPDRFAAGIAAITEALLAADEVTVGVGALVLLGAVLVVVGLVGLTGRARPRSYDVGGRG
ncbi:hypothetical protein [Microbacterium album]|uniref:Uncharacterized protein n=1 Tax=Microbacterium album TaxID=2053191 RepID=A0A917IHQ0_9MICO|nr:hypothetical protein [Microbacterium album]GGH49996.1 hypothetical protein GCM10010921_28430 [Microbacterium album]